MLTRLRSWLTGAPARKALPTRVDADVALTGLISEAYEVMIVDTPEAIPARRIFGETNDLHNQLARRASDYDRYRPELEDEFNRLRSELYSLRRGPGKGPSHQSSSRA
jgi:hypothetical protein